MSFPPLSLLRRGGKRPQEVSPGSLMWKHSSPASYIHSSRTGLMPCRTFALAGTSPRTHFPWLTPFSFSSCQLNYVLLREAAFPSGCLYDSFSGHSAYYFPRMHESLECIHIPGTRYLWEYGPHRSYSRSCHPTRCLPIHPVVQTRRIQAWCISPLNPSPNHIQPIGKL